MSAWIVGRNIAGYLPESDVAAFESWEDACDYYVASVREYADTDDEQTQEQLEHDWHAGYTRGDYQETEHGVDFGDDSPVMLATVDSILKEDGPMEGRDHGMIVEDGGGRYISFWLQWSPDSEPDEDF